MKNWICLLLFISLTHVTWSQDKKEHYGYDLLIGAKAGLNFNKVTGTEWLETYNTNMHAGLFVALNGKRLGLQVEGFWSMNTAVTDTSFGGLYSQYFQAGKDSVATGKFTFHNFSVPVMLNFKLTQWFWLQGGLQYSTKFSQIDQDNLIEAGQFIFSEGAISPVTGIWLNMGKVGPIPKFNLGARFLTNLNNINELGNQQRWRNQRLQFHIGLGF